MICISILCFGHIANEFNAILSILKEVIIFPEKVDLFRIGKTNVNALRPKYDFFLRRISMWRQKVGSLCWKVGLHDLPSYGNSTKKLVVKYPYLFGNTKLVTIFRKNKNLLEYLQDVVKFIANIAEKDNRAANHLQRSWWHQSSTLASDYAFPDAYSRTLLHEWYQHLSGPLIG